MVSPLWGCGFLGLGLADFWAVDLPLLGLNLTVKGCGQNGVGVYISGVLGFFQVFTSEVFRC